MTRGCPWVFLPGGWPHPSKRNWPIVPLERWFLISLLLSLAHCLTELNFTSPLYYAHVPENAYGNTVVISDEKMGMFLEDESLNLRYRITGGDPENFFKANARFVGNFCFLEIRVKTGNRKVLNRESKDSYLLLMKTQHKRQDRTKEDLPGANTQVLVTITDLNDLTPIFLETKYEVRISEDTPLYTSVAKMKAEDPDDGLNGQVYYSFQNPVREFAIHPTSGVVSLTRPLSQPEQPRFELLVVARDRGLQLPGYFPSTSTLIVNVTVVNVFEPTIKVTELPKPLIYGHLMVMAIINVYDGDRGPSGEVKSLEIVEGDPDRVFRIVPGASPDEFNLAALNTLRWEEVAYGFNLSLKVTDNGARPRVSYKPVRINSPPTAVRRSLFTHEEYDVAISETAPPGSKVVAISTWLPGIEMAVSFSIVAGNEGGYFQVDRRSGVLLTARPLDADTKDSYSLTVAATMTSGFSAKQQNSAKIIIRVLDANDHTPIIVAPQGIVTVEEHQNPGSWVTQVRAQDYDSGENKHVSYSLANADVVPFTIDHFTGDIRTNRTLDYETENRVWHLRVRASDWGVPYRRQSEKTIVVRVLDVNDNRPQFEQIDCTGFIDRTAPLGTEVLTLSALDFDEGNIISYRILSGNDDRCFQLDSTSGVLTLTCDLQELKLGERLLNVTATDGQHFADTMTLRLQLVNQRYFGGPWADLDCRGMGIAKKWEEQISLAASNNPKEETSFRMMTPAPPPNEHPPEVYVSRVNVRVRENSEPGTIVHHVEARDLDEGYDGYLVYGISSGNVDCVFDIGMESGDLVVAGFLDRERLSKYSLNITIYDLGKPQLSASHFITVDIVDENDNTPRFDKAAYSFFLPENVPNGTIVYQLLASDPDEGSNGVISYHLETDKKDFYLDPVFGRLSVARPLDFEMVSVYELRVVAADGGGRFSYAYVTVELVDINDCAPEFPEGSMSHVRVPEDLPVGAMITLVTAHDPDSTNLIYILDGDDEGMFELDTNTAVLRLAKPLDFERKSAFNISIRATDDGRPPLSSETKVIIQIVDVNENVHTPVFGYEGHVLETKISEASPPHSLIVSVPARDGDLPLNPADAFVSYAVVGEEGVGLFYINQNGDLYTSAWLDRETTPRYWLTVQATDSGTIPQHATLHIYVEVTDVNDNRPMSSWPVYWPAVSENSPPNTLVGTVVASDPDLEPSGRGNMSFSIVAGDPQSFFRIDGKSGEIRTTDRLLDREHAAEHFLHVLITDGDDPSTALSSTAYVIVSVSDENDHAPAFAESLQKVTAPSYPPSSKEEEAPIAQLLRDEDLLPINGYREWESVGEGSGFDSVDKGPQIMGPWSPTTEGPTKIDFNRSSLDEETDFFIDPFAMVFAQDLDEGENGLVNYKLDKEGWLEGEAHRFKIHRKSGVIYAKRDLQPNKEYKLKVVAFDGGRPQRHSSCVLVINTVPLPTSSPHPPTLRGGVEIATSVLEDDPVGHVVQFVHAEDEDGDPLWFSIVDGNEEGAFAIGMESGNILVAKSLDAERRTSYNLTVAVTDGIHRVTAVVRVSVIDVNDNRPFFSHPTYELEISENTPVGATVFTLTASDKDADPGLSFGLVNAAQPSSEGKFKVSPLTGDIILQEELDREVQDHHILTVSVKDRITPNKSNFARVIVTIRDYNDHSPQFLASSYSASATETLEVGSKILQVAAVDKDRGDSGRITYSIVSGNIGGTFSLDPTSGIISLVRPVSTQFPKYGLSIKASDNGSPPKYTEVVVEIVVIISSQAAPRFSSNEYLFEISESAKIGTYIGSLATESHLGVVFSIMPNEVVLPMSVNPSSGVLSLNKLLDYEKVRSYNLTVIATSMNDHESKARVMISVKDENDNAPHFLQNFYEGHISEAASAKSVVLMKENQPLVVLARDEDASQNANLVYTILNEDARRYFSIDSSTGAIQTVASIDHEVVSQVNFTVSVHDSGRPRLTSPTAASVSVTITDINDVPPTFLQQEYNASLFLPTYKDVTVVLLTATDLDFDGKASLTYAIAAGNADGKFKIDHITGLISVNDSTNLSDFYKLKGTVSDGQFDSSTTVNVFVSEVPVTGFRFARDKYFASVEENSTSVESVAMVHLLGTEVNEHLTFRILNPTDGFEIRRTSGVIQTTGLPFDREEKENYVLIVEAASSKKTNPPRISHVPVHVVVVDKNDNPPIFVNTPYYGVVPVDSPKGATIFQVEARDFDANDNGRIRYELHRGNGELFNVRRMTGEVVLKGSLQGLATDHELDITAYDGGSPPHSSQVTVRLKIVDRSQPIFEKQFYSASVLENAELHSPVITMTARSQLNRKLIYSLSEGNEHQKFAISYEDGIVTVTDKLDYEIENSYGVSVRAIDAVTGKYTEVSLSVQVLDTNDNPPKFTQSFYNVSVSEAAAVASPILQVMTTDEDSKINSGLSYHLEGPKDELVHFYMESSSGMLVLKKSLDKEFQSYHHFMVVATDFGTPPLSSTAQIYITVVDLNDNPPEFDQPSYQCTVSEGAVRGQFVSLIAAFDKDITDDDKLVYSIVSGNEFRVFAIDASTGTVTVWNHQRLRERSEHLLNISVTDGVFTAYTRLSITATPVNAHTPVFKFSDYKTRIKENSPPETYLTRVSATDEDSGSYGDVTYHFVGDESGRYFKIGENTGEVWTLKSFDREEQDQFVYTVMAKDIGGGAAFAKLTVHVDDENDNLPVFSQKSYRTLLRSNSTKGTRIMKVTAEDADAGINAKVTYRFHDSTLEKISSIFSLNEETGEIFLEKVAIQLGENSFELLVEAVDGGAKALRSKVIVFLRIIDSQVDLPKFSSVKLSFNIEENTKPGSLIGLVAARFDGPLEYTVSWGNDEVDPPVAVNTEGGLYLRSLLDYEKQPKFSVIVSAHPKADPELIASTTVVVEVQDNNDEIPVFESEKYYVSVSEDAIVGTNIFKLSAKDADEGRNSELHYILKDTFPLEEEPVFALHPYSGWLTLNKKLDAENKAKYNLTAVVVDSGTPPQSSKAQITLQVIDCNDNPPIFSRPKYHATVREDVLPGTVVLKLDVEDKDVDSQNSAALKFYITSGNRNQRFDIRRGGQIYVAKELDREVLPAFVLTVAVTDGVYVSNTQVNIEVLDVNDNTPICINPTYNHTVPEDAYIGMKILEVTAHDPDVVAPPQYYLSGEGSEKFSLDQSSGQLSLQKSLDRESEDTYDLKVTVRDGGNPKWQCFCSIGIIVTDINDNKPAFTQDSYSINVPENSQSSLILMKINAIDHDMGLNRKVTYSLKGSNKFEIDRQTGILRVMETLDREKQAMYNLTVMAHDHGVPRLSSFASILVLVSDINDNPPEFASHTYYTTILESTTIGSDIVRVLATSKDSGNNAEITYSIVGGNEHRRFAVHHKTGVVTVVEELDFERGSNYLLTIQAKDGGDPSLSNHAVVNVTITDVNDNSPIFIQNSYSALVNEAAVLHERLIQVVATDQDSGVNGKLSYAIAGGDPLQQFYISKKDGWISVARPLDREAIASYTLEIIALDHGIPERSSYVSVYIEVMDANDNPPTFIISNNTAYVQEDKPVNHLVFYFEVKDNDSDKARNGPPFTFDIVSGNTNNAFRITPDGELRTTVKFDHKVADLYRLQIRVFDNGRPPLFSDTWINIKIIEESQFSPVAFPLHITAFLHRESYVGGSLGKVQASDEDPYDTLFFSLVPQENQMFNYFSIDKRSGMISGDVSLDEGSYLLNVSVSDGKFVTYESASIEINEIDDDMLEGATIIQLKGASPEEFLLSYRRSFHRAIKNILKVKPRDVIIISIQNPERRYKREKSSLLYPSYKEGLLDILFSVRKSGKYLPRSQVQRRLVAERKSLENTLGLSVIDIPGSKCHSFSCTNGHCKEVVILEELQVKVASDAISFVSPLHKHDAICVCPPGYSGRLCETIINQCAYQPCPPYQQCIPQHSEIGYICACPNDLVGATCSRNKSDCMGKETDPQCYSPISPMSLKGKSHIQYHLEHNVERHFSFSMWLRTFYRKGTLAFTAGIFDYSILEIEDGNIQLRWDLGSGQGQLTIASIRVDDGFWHHVAFERIGSTIFLRVDSKWRAEGSSPGSSEILNTEVSYLYIGAELRPGFEEELIHGFGGCIDDPRIENIPLPLSKFSPSSTVASLLKIVDVTPHCYERLESPGLCGGYPCRNGGHCEERDGSFICSCPSRFKGPSCENDSNPCASSPCITGSCVNEGNSYRCDCPAYSSGSRCHIRYCRPNPCLNKGICEEGLVGPICKCTGFTGAYCNVDVNECEKNPCEHGGTCINTYGGFKCMCLANLTGSHCDIPAAVTAFPFGLEEIIFIVGGVTGVIMMALIIVFIVHCRGKRIRGQGPLGQNHVILNCKPIDGHTLHKRNSKMSNIEVSQSCTNRPAPFISSPNESACSPLNNFDTVCNYGSAGDELENLPQYSREFVQNISKSNLPYSENRNPSSLSTSTLRMSCSGSGLIVPHPNSYASSDAEPLHKSWKDALGMNLKDAYYEAGKIHNDVKFKGEYMNLRRIGGASELQFNNRHLKDDSSVHSGASVEDVQEYHWDCSDWARPSQTPLPNILEVPGCEVREDSSYHSNESNESIKIKSGGNQTSMLPVMDLIDPLSDMETLVADELTSQCGNDSLLGSFFSSQPQRYETHPNRYLPNYHLNSETEDERVKLIGDAGGPSTESNIGEGFDSAVEVPSASTPPLGLRLRQNRRLCSKRLGDIGRASLSSVPDDHDPEGVSLFGGASNASFSDTDNVCDIEDSECEIDK